MNFKYFPYYLYLTFLDQQSLICRLFVSCRMWRNCHRQSSDCQQHESNFLYSATFESSRNGRETSRTASRKLSSILLKFWCYIRWRTVAAARGSFETALFHLELLAVNVLTEISRGNGVNFRCYFLADAWVILFESGLIRDKD